MKITTVDPVRLSQLVKVSIESPDRILATRIANGLAQAYIDTDRDARFKVTQQANTWLTERMGELLAKLSELPRIVAGAAAEREPHRVARYIEEVAGAYHRWYDNCRVTPLGGAEVEPVHRTRLWLNNAAGQVLRNGLSLLGVSAPERM